LKKQDELNSEFPRITIITPSYNQGNFIEETIRSVIDQGYPNLEYIIIDGGSTDNTVAIIEQYQQHLSYWVSEKDSGQSDAINKGLKVSTGNIINWLNSDDVMMPGCLHAIASHFKANPGIGLVYGNIIHFNNNTEEVRPLIKATRLHYYSKICFPQPATFFSRDIINTVGLIDEHIHFSMDWDLYIRALLAAFKPLQVPEFLCRFRIHSNSKSVSAFSKRLLVDNALIFYSITKSIDPGFDFIDTLYKELNIDIPVVPKVYKVSVIITEDELYTMTFYYLEHRSKTLFAVEDYKGLQQLVNVSRKYFKKNLRTSKVIRSRYLLSKLPKFILRNLLRMRKTAG